MKLKNKAFLGVLGLISEAQDKTDAQQKGSGANQGASDDHFAVSLVDQVPILIDFFLVFFTSRGGTFQLVLDIIGVVVVQGGEVGKQGAKEQRGDRGAHQGFPDAVPLADTFPFVLYNLFLKVRDGCQINVDVRDFGGRGEYGYHRVAVADFADLHGGEARFKDGEFVR